MERNKNIHEEEKQRGKSQTCCKSCEAEARHAESITRLVTGPNSSNLSDVSRARGLNIGSTQGLVGTICDDLFLHLPSRGWGTEVAMRRGRVQGHYRDVVDGLMLLCGRQLSTGPRQQAACPSQVAPASRPNIEQAVTGGARLGLWLKDVVSGPLKGFSGCHVIELGEYTQCVVIAMWLV
jgi:hypothetical protein